MRPQLSILHILGATLLMLLSNPTAHAQLPRAYVSHNGSDANPCTRNSPCRQITRGLDAAQTNGEVLILDTGHFKPFTVTKAATIAAAPGAAPVVTTAAGVTAVKITAGAGSVVVIKGLTLRGAFDSLGSNGINGGPSATVHVEGCTIVGFSIGIAHTSTGPLSVKDTSIKSCSSGVQTATTRALFVNCWIESNGTGYLAGVGSRATIRGSLMTNNGAALTAGGAGTDLTVDGCTVHSNTDGIRSDSPGTTVRVANSVVTGNTNGLVTFGGGALLSRSPWSNTLEGNTTNGTFTGTYAAK